MLSSIARHVGMPKTASHRSYLVLFCLFAAITVLGWRLHWFLTDDAYIAFRYVSNSYLGLGYLWNAPPFRPVEGYTSFLWVALLDIVWRLFNVEPPQTANLLSLGFGLGTLWLTLRLAHRIVLPSSLERMRLFVVAMCLVLLTTNRNFLVWLSSGLETALFNFLFLAWFATLWEMDAKTNQTAISLRLMFWGALLALTRPDGLLFTSASVFAVVVFEWRRRAGSWPHLLPLAPLLLVLAHLLWRRHTYGEWLPNTYYAKHVRPWPEAGWRYLALYVLHHCLWFLPLVALLAGLKDRRRTGIAIPFYFATATATLLAQIGYYTLSVGGDHFEFRIFSHTVPLVALLALNLLLRFESKPVLVGGALSFWVLSSLLPWMRFFEERPLMDRQSTGGGLSRPLALHFPKPLRPYVQWHDTLDSWLVKHAVQTHFQEHKVFHLHSVAWLPTRTEGFAIPPEGNPIAALGAVGVGGWVFPHVAIIDRYGLNDWVVARTEVTNPNEKRTMAHDRVASAEYVACFHPNVVFNEDEKTVAYHRERKMEDGSIQNCERYYRIATMTRAPEKWIAGKK